MPNSRLCPAATRRSEPLPRSAAVPPTTRWRHQSSATTHWRPPISPTQLRDSKQWCSVTLHRMQRTLRSSFCAQANTKTNTSYGNNHFHMRPARHFACATYVSLGFVRHSVLKQIRKPTCLMGITTFTCVPLVILHGQHTFRSSFCDRTNTKTNTSYGDTHFHLCAAHGALVILHAVE